MRLFMKMIDDRSKLVREAVARSLAHLITFFDIRDIDKLKNTQGERKENGNEKEDF
jgi:hypothetical protein